MAIWSFLKRNKELWGLVLLGVALATALFSPKVQRLLAVDDCLDAGGRWNYESDTCEGARSR